MIGNNSFDFLRTKRFYTPFEFLDLITGTTRGSQGEMIISSLDNSSFQIELGVLNDSGITGIFLTSNIRLAILAPFDLDPKHEYGLRFSYLGLKTDDPISFEYSISAVTSGYSSGGSSIASISYGSTASYIFAPTIFNNYTLYWSQRLSTKLTNLRSEIDSGILLSAQIDINAATNLTAIYLLGMELDYVPYMCNGLGSELDRPLNITALGGR